jgi:hypothetical protein
MSEKNGRIETGEEPDIIKNWNRLYALVLLNLCLWIFVFYIIKRIFE